MLSADLHAHTDRSLCGLHSLLEMLDAAVERGLQAVAITDHGPFLGGRGPSSVFLKRFPGEYHGLRVWKGIEANVLPEGDTDVPQALIPLMDVVLLGIHGLPQGEPAGYYTDLLIACIERNPFVDILVHPDIEYYPLDVRRVVEAASEHGLAVEFNNANLTYGKTHIGRMAAMAEAVRETGCRAVISGDAHTVFEIGRDDAVRKALANLGLAGLSFLNEDYAATEDFIEERRERKRAAEGRLAVERETA